jgi:hypothetical protein
MHLVSGTDHHLCAAHLKMGSIHAESTFVYHGLETNGLAHVEVVKSLIKALLEDVYFDRSLPFLKDHGLESAVWTYSKRLNMGAKNDEAVAKGAQVVRHSDTPDLHQPTLREQGLLRGANSLHVSGRRHRPAFYGRAALFLPEVSHALLLVSAWELRADGKSQLQPKQRPQALPARQLRQAPSRSLSLLRALLQGVCDQAGKGQFRGQLCYDP